MKSPQLRLSRIPGLFLTGLVLLLMSYWAPAEAGEPWPLRDGKEYFGDVTRYEITSGDITLKKADGKEFTFNASELAFSGKWQLLWTEEFGRALKEDYKTPIGPLIFLILAGVVGISLPTIIGLWGAAHVLGAVSSPVTHVIGFLKVMIILLALAATWLTVSIVMDPEMPVIPDRRADLVLIAFLSVFGPLLISVVLSFHYHRSWWKGMAITFLGGAFSSIVFAALALVSLFVVTRVEVETLITRGVFEPFGLF